MIIKKFCCFAWVLLSLTSCAILSPSIEAPKVTLETLEMLPPTGMSQRFDIGLRMSNPNDRPIKINGIAYTLALNGYKLVDGVGNNVPEVAAFSEVSFTVQASTNLFEAVRFINSFLAGDGAEQLDYRLKADLAIAGLPMRVSVEEAGKVPLLGAAE